MNYPELSFIYIILPTLFILFTMQTKLGSKINTLNNRLFKALGIDKESEQENDNHESHKESFSNVNNKKITNNSQNIQQNMNTNEFTHPYGGGNNVNSGQNFDSMYLDTNNPLMNANNPGSTQNPPHINNYNQTPSESMMEPMPANGGFLSGSFY